MMMDLCARGRFPATPSHVALLRFIGCAVSEKSKQRMEMDKLEGRMHRMIDRFLLSLSLSAPCLAVLHVKTVTKHYHGPSAHRRPARKPRSSSAPENHDQYRRGM